jgi:hypothetical protein
MPSYYALGIHGANVNRVLPRDSDFANYLATAIAPPLTINFSTDSGIAIQHVMTPIDLTYSEVVVEDGSVSEFMCRGTLVLKNGKVSASRGLSGLLSASSADLVLNTIFVQGQNPGSFAGEFINCTGTADYFYVAEAYTALSFESCRMHLGAQCHPVNVERAIMASGLCNLSFDDPDGNFNGSDGDIDFMNTIKVPWAPFTEAVTDLAGTWVYSDSGGG